MRTLWGFKSISRCNRLTFMTMLMTNKAIRAVNNRLHQQALKYWPCSCPRRFCRHYLKRGSLV